MGASLQGRHGRTSVRLFLVVADVSVSRGRAISSLSAEGGVAKEQNICVTYTAGLTTKTVLFLRISFADVAASASTGDERQRLPRLPATRAKGEGSKVAEVVKM